MSCLCSEGRDEHGWPHNNTAWEYFQDILLFHFIWVGDVTCFFSPFFNSFSCSKIMSLCLKCLSSHPLSFLNLSEKVPSILITLFVWSWWCFEVHDLCPLTSDYSNHKLKFRKGDSYSTLSSLRKELHDAHYQSLLARSWSSLSSSNTAPDPLLSFLSYAPPPASSESVQSASSTEVTLEEKGSDEKMLEK